MIVSEQLTEQELVQVQLGNFLISVSTKTD